MCGVAQQASYPKGATKAGPSPPTPPTPPTPTAHHYNDPKDGCASDELEITISGVAGYTPPPPRTRNPKPEPEPPLLLFFSGGPRALDMSFLRRRASCSRRSLPLFFLATSDRAFSPSRLSCSRSDFCTPKCTLFKPCPADKPTGVTAKPQCALQDASSGLKYCALMCSPSLPIVDQKAADAQCGTNASCKSVQAGIGLCTYDD